MVDDIGQSQIGEGAELDPRGQVRRSPDLDHGGIIALGPGRECRFEDEVNGVVVLHHPIGSRSGEVRGVHIDHPTHVDAQPGFLKHLSPQSVSRMLTVLDSAAGQGPPLEGDMRGEPGQQ